MAVVARPLKLMSRLILRWDDAQILPIFWYDASPFHDCNLNRRQGDECQISILIASFMSTVIFFFHPKKKLCIVHKICRGPIVPANGLPGNPSLQASPDCFNFDKDVIFQKLRDKAVVASKCGQNAVVERKTILTPRSDVTTYAIVTNVVHYSKTSKPVLPDSLSNGDHKKRKAIVTGTRSSRTRKRSKESNCKSRSEV